MIRNIKSSLIVLAVCALSSTVRGEVKPNALFSDNAVLQQGVNIPVWGSAKEEEKVTVTFDGQTETTVAKDGKWMVRLKPHKAGGPFTLTIKGENTITVTNVMVGEVWICSGQSNMAFRKGKLKDGVSESLPKLRMFTVALNPSLKPKTEATGNWVECSPEAAGSFSAVGYFFGRDIHKATGIPVGMIHSAVGGSPAQSWISLSGLEKDPSLHGHVQSVKSLLVNDKAPEGAKPAGKRSTIALFNGMIAPLIPYAIKGVIWYQGESNNGNPFEYRTLFPRLISDWREKWVQGNFPFLFVQICPYKEMTPEIREAQFLTWKKTPNTAMAVTVDVGEAENIHPTKKEPVGARLALAARALVYGEKIEYSGPEYDSLKIDKNRAVLSFKHTGSGLVAKDGSLKGFTIAGKDKNFVPAKAEIQDDTVVVTSEQVPVPVAVRYGWSNVPDVNLWNKEGLPASPFRTDPESLTQDALSAKKTAKPSKQPSSEEQ
jgi:sialate O-acetylesterase